VTAPGCGDEIGGDEIHRLSLRFLGFYGNTCCMKTSLDIPDELARDIKVLAVREGKKLKDVVAEALRARLAVSSGGPRASLRDIRPKRVGGPIRSRQPGDDILGEMIDARRR